MHEPTRAAAPPTGTPDGAAANGRGRAGEAPDPGLPAAVRERALDLLVDYLAVARRGAATPVATTARAALAPAGGPSTVAGSARRAPAADAALLNGIAAHSIELDDTYEPASIHPGVAVWPAVIAVAEEEGASLDELLRAAVAGYDAACAAGDRLDPAVTYARGFHPTGVCGPIGAAVGVAELLGLDAAARRDAVGIAASAAGGLLEFLADGAWTKPLHAGQAAAAGIRAARLAAAGFRGPANAMSGAHGFLHAFGGRADAAAELDGRARGAGVLGTSVKPYPCCRYIHAGLDLALQLVREHGLTGDDVESVSCAVLSAGWELVAGPPEEKLRIDSQVDAQFSLPFALALALVRGRATLEDFEAAPGLAPELAPVMARVHCRRSERLDAAFPALWGAEIELRTRGGETLSRATADAPGSPTRPLGRDGLRAKASSLVGAQRAERLVEACARATGDTAVGELLAAAFDDPSDNGLER